MGYAVLFPGQGSQFSGMGADLFNSRPDLLGKRAEEILGWSLEEMCLLAPEELLIRTEHAQPALFALSYVLWEELRPHLPKPPDAGAGHSLGEYTALTAAGVLSYDEALLLVAERGRAMAAAADQESSGMAALIGAHLDVAEEVAAGRRAAGGRLYVANRNAPGQVVMAGGQDDIEWLQAAGADLGIRRVVPLKVAGAFHSPFMAPAANRLRQALSEVKFAEPEFPVFANIDATPISTVTGLIETLVGQVISPVLFAEILTAMSAMGIDRFIHVGPGDVTASLAKRSIPGAATFVVSDQASIGPAASWLGTIA